MGHKKDFMATFMDIGIEVCKIDRFCPQVI